MRQATPPRRPEVRLNVRALSCASVSGWQKPLAARGPQRHSGTTPPRQAESTHQTGRPSVWGTDGRAGGDMREAGISPTRLDPTHRRSIVAEGRGPDGTCAVADTLEGYGMRYGYPDERPGRGQHGVRVTAGPDWCRADRSASLELAERSGRHPVRDVGRPWAGRRRQRPRQHAAAGGRTRGQARCRRHRPAGTSLTKTEQGACDDDRAHLRPGDPLRPLQVLP